MLVKHQAQTPPGGGESTTEIGSGFWFGATDEEGGFSLAKHNGGIDLSGLGSAPPAKRATSAAVARLEEIQGVHLSYGFIDLYHEGCVENLVIITNF